MNLDTNSATLRILDLENLGGVKRTLIRWLQPRPLVHVVSGSPKGILYPLPEVVARIRQRSQNGLSGDFLNKVVTFDAQVRAERGTDDIYLGDSAPERAAEFVCCLSPEEAERARGVQRQVREAAIRSGLPGVEYLRQITLIHPAVVRYVLSSQANELPWGDSGWRSWVSALWAVNPEKNT